MNEKEWKKLAKITLDLTNFYMDELFASGKRTEVFLEALKRIGKRRDGKKGST